MIEHYAGAFPLWLAPVQAIVLPISDKHNEYGKKIVDELIRSGIRTGFDQEPERIGKKIRIATLQKIPYMIIIGDKEVNEGSVSVRTREGKDIGTTKITEFIQTLKNNH